MDRHLGCSVDERLGIALGEPFNYPNLSFVREDGRDQGDRFARDERTFDQTFPRWRAAVHGKFVRLTARGPEWKLTICVRFVTLQMIVGVGRLRDSSSVGSMPIVCLSKSGGSAAAGADPPRYLTQPHEANPR